MNGREITLPFLHQIRVTSLEELKWQRSYFLLGPISDLDKQHRRAHHRRGEIATLHNAAKRRGNVKLEI